jgi:hypothetical protein
MMSKTGAATPIVCLPGRAPMTADVPAMTETLTISEARLPCRSANRPKNTDPSGRMRNVMAKMA